MTDPWRIIGWAIVYGVAGTIIGGLFVAIVFQPDFDARGAQPPSYRQERAAKTAVSAAKTELALTPMGSDPKP